MSSTIALALAGPNSWLAAQSRRPDVVISEPGHIFVAFRRALATGCDWVWVVGPDVEPAPDALATLLAALDRSPPPLPVALSSMVCDRNGGPCEPALPSGDWTRVAEAVDAAEQRLMLMRDAPFASLLLRREEAAREAPPAPRRFGALADREYTARLLRDASGHMVADSVATATCEIPFPTPWDRALLLGSGAWTRGERLRLAGRAARDVRRVLGRAS
jgi:GT2 family glycosyltransferase